MNVAKFPSRPRVLKLKPENIPAALKKLDQWVLWGYALSRPKKDGTASKWTKRPQQLNGYGASSTNPQHWCNFTDALNAYQEGRADGIGFVTAKTDPYVLIDLDHAFDLTTGKIEPWALEILKAAQQEKAYCEISPGRGGFHVIKKGPQNFAGRKFNNVEIYSHSRFFTMSGWTVPAL